MSKRKRMSRHPPMRSLAAAPYTSDCVLTEAVKVSSHETSDLASEDSHAHELTDAVKVSSHVTSDLASEDSHIHDLTGGDDQGDLVNGGTHDFERGSERQESPGRCEGDKSPATVLPGHCEGQKFAVHCDEALTEQHVGDITSDLQLDDLPAAVSLADLACSAPHCRATFATPRHYVRHVLLEHGEGCDREAGGCPLCGHQLGSVPALHNHLLEHTAYRPFSCAECGQRHASGWAVQQHRALCRGPGGASKRRRMSTSDQLSSSTLCCDTCGLRVHSLGQLVAHNYSCQGAGGRSRGSGPGEGLQCDKCAFSTSSEELMQQHEAQHKCSEWIRRACQTAPLAPVAPFSADLADIRSILSVTRAPVVCGTVDSSGDRSPPPAHAVTARLQASPLFGKEGGDRLLPSLLAASTTPAAEEDVEDPSFDVIRAMKAKGEFPCRLCGQVFPNLRAMKGHNRLHMGSAPYSCNVCAFSSGDKATLVRHMKQHNGERPYECRLCRFAFTTKANCERHLKNRHQLRTRDQLNDSMLVHAAAEAGQLCPASLGSCTTPGVKHAANYCTVCRLDVKQWRAFREHVRSEHGVVALESDLSAGSFQCSVCDLQFGELTAAAQHVCSHQRNQQRVDSPPTMVSVAARPGVPVVGGARQGSVSPLASPEASNSSASLGQHAIESAADTCDDAPLDLSVRDRQPEEAQPRQHVPEDPMAAAAAAMMGSPLGLYMRYGAPVPLFVMSSVLNDQRELLARYSSTGNYPLPLPTAGFFTRPQQSSESPVVQDLGTSSDVTVTGSLTNRDPPAVAGGVAENQTDVQQKPKQRRYRTQRPFSCCYCEARFTLSTNMDRHIKNHHPDKWERKSRGGRRVTSGLSTPASSSSVPLPAVTAVSTSTATTGCVSPAAGAEAGPADSTIGCVSDEDAPLVIDEQAASRCEDLASVARLVDSARTHNFQQYFGSEQASDPGASGSSGAEEDTDAPAAGSGSERRRSAYSAAPNKIPCRVCRREFPWSSSLRRHELTHSGHKPFSCPHCAVHFTTKSNCDRHMARKHAIPPSVGSLSPARTAPFWCPGCGDTFPQLAAARDHVQLEHEQLCDQLSGWTAFEAAGQTFEDDGADHDKVLCVVCCTAYDDIDTLSSHIHTRHLPAHTDTTVDNTADAAPAQTQQQQPERAKKREHLNDISARLSASLLKQQTLVNGHAP